MAKLTANEVVEQIQKIGGLQDAAAIVADKEIESWEVKNILQMAKAAAWTLDWAFERLMQLAYEEDCEAIRKEEEELYDERVIDEDFDPNWCNECGVDCGMCPH